MHLVDRLVRPSAAAVAAALAFVFVADALLSVDLLGWPASGLLDDPAHLATALIVLGAWRPRTRVFAATFLVVSVVIDIDHLPDVLGSRVLNPDTARPVTHSLAVLAASGLIAGMLTRSRLVGAAVAAGFAVHFFRDVAGSPGVPLLWPLSALEMRVPYVVYATVLGVIAAVGIARTARGSRILKPAC
jgi:inner membrane protein